MLDDRIYTRNSSISWHRLRPDRKTSFFAQQACARCGNDEGVDRTTFVRAYALRRRVSSIGAMPTALSLGRTRLKQICAFIGRNKILDRTSPDALFHHRATMLKRSERFNPHHVQPLAQFVDHLVFSQSPR